MKKNYLKTGLLAAGLLFSSLASHLDAQLSGLYTINSGAATAGTNFQSFNDFESALSANGINGPVTVDVVANSGPYNEQVLFSSVTGASPANRITINGNGNLLTFNSTNTAQRYTMGFSGADFFTVNELNLNGTGTYAFTCLLYGGADYNIFTKCTFSVNAGVSSTNYFPVVVSGSGTAYSTAGNSGNHNLWEDCEMFSGYSGITMYGPTGVGQYCEGNKVINCHIRDYYIYGMYMYYQINSLASGNIIERPTRTNHTTCYGILYSSTAGTTLEGNTVQKLYEQSQTQTGTTYCIYVTGNTLAAYDGPKNVIRNNIVQDIRSHSTIYAYYMLYVKGDVFHNTVSIDHPTATTGIVYGMYFSTTGSDRYVNAANNLIYINRGGSSTKYAFYYATTNMVTSDNNNFWFGNAGSNYHAGYSGAAQTSLGNLQSATSQEASTHQIDPVFVNTASDVTPTNNLFNDLGTPEGVAFDHSNAVRSQTSPDIGAIEFLSPNCAGIPTQTVTGPTWELCPGEVATFSIGNLTPDMGLTYQWQMSDLSAVGPFTLTGGSGATNISYTSPPNTSKMWYSAIITCTAPGGGSVQAVAEVNIAATTTNTIPYYENFENIGMPDRLPNCSWAAPGLGASARTYLSAGSNNLLPRSGTGFASFTNPSNVDYFYTNGIYMEPGVTYSASLWYQTDLSGANNWTDLSILVGTSQSTTGLTSVASTGGPAVAIIYKSLSNTFSVPAPGIYYVAVSATGSSGTAQNLSWDDLLIEIPCALNAPQVTMNANKTSICAGESIVLTATGADNFSWDNSAGSGGIVTVQPLYNTFYTVVGTNTNSGCSSTASQMIQVKPSPVMGVISFPATVCEGAPLNLQAYGADSYAWNTGDNGASVVVKPTGPTSYTIQGSNIYGCTTSHVHNVTPNELPVIQVVVPPSICEGDQITGSATGAASYNWISNLSYITGNNVLLSPNVSTTYTVEGTDVFGCTGEHVVAITVNVCTGLSEAGKYSGLSLYPNPNNGTFVVNTGNTHSKLVQVTDITGRVIISAPTTEAEFDVNINEFAAGIYYVEVSSSEGVNRIKVIKQ